VDDSKATNPHAASASLTSYDPIVWIAGGQLKAPISTNWYETLRQIACRRAI